MKRILAVVLAIIMVFSLAACGKENTLSKPDKNIIQEESIVSVPELVGKNIEEIEKYKKDFEFAIKYSKNLEYENGIIFQQSIDPGIIMKKASKIEIIVSKRSSKMIEMPNVFGKTKQEAIDILLKAGFMHEYISITTKIDIENPRGVINSQDPIAGEKVFSDSDICLYIWE